MGSQDAHILNPGTCENVTLHGKRDLADGIKIMNLFKTGRAT